MSSRFKKAGSQDLYKKDSLGCIYFAEFCDVSYRLVHLPGHVSSEDRLHDQSGSLLPLVAFPLHVHPLVLLDGGGRLRTTHELGQAEETRDIHVSTNTYFKCLYNF